MTEALHAAEWLVLATDDLDAARALAALPTGFPTKVCFFAQQCAERAIKAVLVHQGGEIRRSHDPGELLESARAAGAEIPAEIWGVAALAPYAVQFRYAVLDAVTAADAQAAIGQAAAALRWAHAAVLSPR